MQLGILFEITSAKDFKMSKAGKIIIYSVLIILGFYFLVNGIMQAKGFLAPMLIAILLTMLVLPVSHKLEGYGMNRGWAAFFSDLLIIVLAFGFFLLLSAQISSFIEDWPKISRKIEPRIEKLEDYVQNKTGFNLEKKINLSRLTSGQADSTNSAKSSTGNTVSENSDGSTSESSKSGNLQRKKILSGLADSVFAFLNFLGTMLLVFVYIFFFLLYRSKFEKSLLKMVPDRDRSKTKNIIGNSAKVAQQYLVGKFLLIIFLAVFYSLGMILIGVKYAVFAGIIAAILSLVPYIGNFIGGGISVIFSFLGGGGIGSALGVIGVFTVAQFIESYILEPYIVGEKVELNPVVIILIVVLGNAVWGIVGMVIAIPVTGIIKVVFDYIPIMHPYGYLLGNEDVGSSESSMEKAGKWIKNKLGIKSKN